MDNTLQTVMQQASDAPWDYSFTTLMRTIEAQHKTMPLIGKSSRIDQECFTLGQAPSLAFAPREIAHIDHDDDKYHIQLFSVGMIGPNGPLPIHYTEMIKDRVETHRDRTWLNFLNMFQHRALSLLYRAWANGQATAGLDRPEEERFSRYIQCLSGTVPTASALPSHAQCAHSAHLVRHHHDPVALAKVIAHYFAVPAAIEEYCFHWLALEQQDQTHIGQGTDTAMMGCGAIMGSHVPDVQQKFRIVLGPLSLTDYVAFAPDGDNFAALIALIRSFIGYQYTWEICLQLRHDAVPAAYTNNTVQLGRSAWINTQQPRQQPISGMQYEPECYSTYRNLS